MTLSIEEYHEHASTELQRSKEANTTDKRDRCVGRAAVYAELAKTAQAAEPEVDTLLKESFSQSPAAEDPELVPHGARYAADEKIVAVLTRVCFAGHCDTIIQTLNEAGLYVVEVPQ